MRWLHSAGLLLGTALFALASSGDATAQTSGKAQLVVKANGFKGTKGRAIFAVFNTKDSWLKLEKSVKVQKLKIDGGTVTATFADLPAGNYAVSVIHDENSNGKLDMHWLPVPGPDEGAGVSNDASATIGPPSYGDALFKLNEGGGVISLKMRY